MVAHARSGAPEEVCGILGGTRDGREHRVAKRHPAENVADRPRSRYEIDPREQLDRMETVADAGREVVGFYHSHPRDPPEPSPTDVEQATWPDRSYVIVSLDEDATETVGAWRWTGTEFEPETVRVVESE